MVPLVFVDSRKQLPREAIATLNLSSKRNEIWLIKPADPRADALLDGSVTVVDPRDISGALQMINEFRSVYVHLTTNTVNYERSCFERFIFLHLWAIQSGTSAVWHFDTDAWASCDLRALTPPGFDTNVVAGLPKGLEGDFPSVTVSQAYITSDVLHGFTNFLLQDFFSVRRRDLEAWFARRRGSSELGGVSDMMAWGTFLRDNPGISVLNSFSSDVSGYMMIDTLYQLMDQLRAQGRVLAGRRLIFVPSPEGLFLRFGSTSIAVAGIHLAGADKPLIFALAGGRRLVYMGLNQRYARARHRLRRRARRALERNWTTGSGASEGGSK